LFVGDIMLDRNVARSAEAEGAESLFAGVKELFVQTDLRVGNLEGTITTNPSIARQDNKILRFTFDPGLASSTLVPLGFDALSLANNHSLDFAESGYRSTRAYLEAFGTRPFGHSLNTAGDLSTVIEAKGKRLCLVGYHALFAPAIATVVAEIKNLRSSCSWVVVFAHWGEEYETHSSAAQQEAAHAFVDAGANLVIGAHPHVVQEVEIYQGRAIFYSLGNFMFDQNFSWETTHGLAVMVTFADGETAFSLIPTTIKDQKAAIAEGPERQKTLDLVGIADFTLP
jgi:poly-gamma-glutamate capsule biosynthesis protein CapA/YwtB (metallophosphatase superfamily)